MKKKVTLADLHDDLAKMHKTLKTGFAEMREAILETHRLLAFGFEQQDRRLADIKADTAAIGEIKADTGALAGIKADTSALVRAAMRADERLIRIESAVVRDS